MAIYEVTSFRGGLSDYEDKGISGSFKFGSNLDIRKDVDSLSCGQALVDEGILGSQSPSASISPSSSTSPSSSPSATTSPSASTSPSVSVSLSPSGSTGISPSPSLSRSLSPSLSPSVTTSSSPSLSPSASGGLTTVFADLIRTFVKASDGYTYGFGTTGYVYRRDSDALWLRVYKDADGAIKGAEEKPSDDGRRWLYWATNTKLRRKQIFGLSNWNDVETINDNLTPADFHTMRQIGGSLYICNGSYLALVGYDDSYTNEALDLIPGNIAKTIVERDGRANIGTVRQSDPDRGVNGAIDTEIPIAQVGDNGELFFANMVDSVSIKKLPGGGKVNPDGICNEIEQVNFFEWEQTALSWLDKQSVGNMALMAVYGATTGKGGIYSFGRKNKNHPLVLNLEYQLDADELGAIITVNGTTLVSYRDGADFGVKAVDSDTKAIGICEGLDFKVPVKKPVNISQWNMVELFMSPLPTGCSIEYYYKMNKTGNWVQAYTADGETSFDTTSAKKVVFRLGAEGEVFSRKIVLNPSSNTTPEIYRERVYFE